jgi:hypothetical protein
MLSIISLLALTFFGVISYFINYFTGIHEFLTISIIFFTIDALSFFILFFINSNSWEYEINRLNEIHKYKKLLMLKKEQFDNVKIEWVKYLTIEYPNLEKDIFNKMSLDEKNQLTSYFVKYPQLSSSSMFNTLIQGISNMYNNIYELESYIADEEEKLKNSIVNKWHIFHSSLCKDYINSIK